MSVCACVSVRVCMCVYVCHMCVYVLYRVCVCVYVVAPWLGQAAAAVGVEATDVGAGLRVGH